MRTHEQIKADMLNALYTRVPQLASGHYLRGLDHRINDMAYVAKTLIEVVALQLFDMQSGRPPTVDPNGCDHEMAPEAGCPNCEEWIRLNLPPSTRASLLKEKK